jgi:hypothetical protein
MLQDFVLSVQYDVEKYCDDVWRGRVRVPFWDTVVCAITGGLRDICNAGV